jgi:undecaprenyl diphosphate synthase
LLHSSDIHDNEVKINFIGRWAEQFPQSLKNIMQKCEEATGKYSKHTLNFFLAYSGDDEMVEAVKKIVQSGVKAEAVTGALIKDNLMTSKLPRVDYLIRTGGEPHLSAGFLMWDLADSQLYFSEKTYPDFQEAELVEALNDYAQRGRRLGS